MDLFSGPSCRQSDAMLQQTPSRTTAHGAPAQLSTTSVIAAAQGAAAMVLVGGSVAVSALLQDAPMHTAQAVRYAVACLLLVAWARLRGIAVLRPVSAEGLWLAGVAATGLVLFNVGLVEGSAHAEPAVLAVAVASVPIVLGVVGPVLERVRPTTRMLVAAGVVTAGAAVVHGFGRSDGTGLLWALLVLVCEAGFTLLAVPVLRRHGPVGVSVWATATAAGVFAALGLSLEGPTAVLRLTTTHLLAAAFLAVAVTAVAFVLWYGAVQRLGSARAGLLTGAAPISAALVAAALAGAPPAPAVWVGLGLVAGGLGVGLWRGRQLGERFDRTAHRRRASSA
jgi:drug/metabolite transporter (DMT)-like permease